MGKRRKKIGRDSDIISLVLRIAPTPTGRMRGESGGKNDGRKISRFPVVRCEYCEKHLPRTASPNPTILHPLHLPLLPLPLLPLPPRGRPYGCCRSGGFVKLSGTWIMKSPDPKFGPISRKWGCAMTKRSDWRNSPVSSIISFLIRRKIRAYQDLTIVN